MGVVYEARQISLDRPVALKMIRAGALAGEDELRRFQNEAEAVAKLDHPHIVPIYEVGEHEGRRYFSMKLIGGRSLQKVLAEYAASPRAAAELMVTIAEAVHHAHQRGILHRDLKPSNILLDEQGRPHVTDFGLAKRVGGGDDTDRHRRRARHAGLHGPRAGLGPQAAGDRADRRLRPGGDPLRPADRPAAVQRRVSDWETLEQVREQPPVPPSRLNAGLPRDLEIICLKCLEKDPQRRYASAAGSGRATCAGSWRASRSRRGRAMPWERAWLWCKRNPVLAGAVGLWRRRWWPWR